ncbi:MAG: hypothetical protein IJ808_09970 [Muribaculaceae bacterium]|nr:hypothetical protein [Muribaculaceae bacterium]
MKKFILVSVMCVVATLQALACGPWVRPSYYVFSAFPRAQMGDMFYERTNQFWREYTDGAAEAWSQQSLAAVDLEEFDRSENAIIKAAITKRDREMTDYLRILISYLNECGVGSEDTWAYPTKQDLKQRDSKLQYIYNRARSYRGKRLSGQYCLLAMRALMLMGDSQGIIKYWKGMGSKQAESVYKDMMRDIYAGALLRTGKKREACDIFAELGDMLSIKWVMRDSRNLEGIKTEYEANPTSPTLVYLVQDYVNNAQSSLESISGADDDEVDEDIKRANQRLKDFIPFALEVVKQGKTDVPALWQSAAGYLTHLLGDSRQGIAMLDKALTMRGTQRMLDNARVCRLVASTATASANNKYLNYLAQELTWLQQVEQKEATDFKEYNFNDNHYLEVLQNLIYDNLSPRFATQGHTNLATGLAGWMAGHETSLSATCDDFYVSDDYYHMLDLLSAQETVDYLNYLEGAAGNELEKMIFSSAIEIDRQYRNDRIGTKWIREGQFEKAIPYLEEVSLQYIGTQAISAYMERNYRVERWFKRQRVFTGELWEWDESPKPVNENQKLQFCHDIIKTTRDYEHASGKERGELAYQLATMLYQASYKGECWYLSRYGQSINDTICYKNEKDFLAEAVHYLDEALRYADNDFDLTQKALYAKAFIPFGQPYVTYTYDEDWNAIPHYNRNSYEYQTLLTLNNFYQAHRNQVATYVSRCDVLRRFRENNL